MRGIKVLFSLRPRQDLNHHYGRAKKVLRALQTNLTNEQHMKEIRSKERFGKDAKNLK